MGADANNGKDPIAAKFLAVEKGVPLPKSDFWCGGIFASRNKFAGEADPTSPAKFNIDCGTLNQEETKAQDDSSMKPMEVTTNDAGNDESCCYRQGNSSSGKPSNG